MNALYAGAVRGRGDSRVPVAPPANVIVRVRRATVPDFESVAQLLGELGRPAPTAENRGALRGTFERHLARPGCASLVAERDGRVVGFMSIEFRDRLNWATPEAWIPDLIVTEPARGLGVGRALLDAGFREAVERKAHRVTLESGYNRQRAHAVYLAAGMTEAGKYFTWVVGRGPTTQ